MKAILQKAPGDKTQLYLGEAPSPASPEAGQVRLVIRASGLNRADISQREGRYPPPKGESEILGLEACGIVDEVGPGVERFKKGDKVIALLAGGGYAEQVLAPAECLLPLPRSMNFVEGAAIIEAFVTAHLNLFQLGEAANCEQMLVHAGASGVGTAAIQMAKSTGKKIWVTVGSEEKASFCKELGGEPILYKTEDFSEKILSQTQGKGVPLILDCVGGAYLEKNLNCLALEGKLILIGLLGGRSATIDLGRLLVKRQQIKGSTLRALPIPRKRQVIQKFESAFFGKFETGELKPIVDKVFSPQQVQQAHEYMETSQNKGKIILNWE